MTDTIYDLLCNYGFSPAKSAEIALDAKRGDPAARMLVSEVGGELDTMQLMPPAKCRPRHHSRRSTRRRDEMTDISTQARNAAKAIGRMVKSNFENQTGLKVKFSTSPDGPLTQFMAEFEESAKSQAAAEIANLRAELDALPVWPDKTAWPVGTQVAKKSGSEWHGKVVGYYSTQHTPRGYCVESDRESGSVQIYPQAALGDGHAERS